MGLIGVVVVVVVVVAVVVVRVRVGMRVRVRVGMRVRVRGRFFSLPGFGQAIAMGMRCTSEWTISSAGARRW